VTRDQLAFFIHKEPCDTGRRFLLANRRRPLRWFLVNAPGEFVRWGLGRVCLLGIGTTGEKSDRDAVWRFVLNPFISLPPNAVEAAERLTVTRVKWWRKNYKRSHQIALAEVKRIDRRKRKVGT
jgi:hypothetical protein